jgi:hypothetical protein
MDKSANISQYSLLLYYTARGSGENCTWKTPAKNQGSFLKMRSCRYENKGDIIFFLG